MIKEKLQLMIHCVFYKYILRHKYNISVDIGSKDGDCSVIVRTDKKGNRFVEKIYFE